MMPAVLLVCVNEISKGEKGCWCCRREVILRKEIEKWETGKIFGSTVNVGICHSLSGASQDHNVHIMDPGNSAPFRLA